MLLVVILLISRKIAEKSKAAQKTKTTKTQL